MNPAGEETFFKIGGTLPSDAPSYLVRDADQKLRDALVGGEFCYLLNSRQMGKSSLCVRAVQELQKRGVRTVYLELSEIGGANAEAATWYATLLNRIGRELGLHREFAAHRRERDDLTPVSSLFSALEEIALTRDDAPIVIILDEIDTVRSLRFPADEFFGALRALYNRRVSDFALRRLTFCLVGSATPADLVTDTRLSPFNIGQQIDLRDFTPSEAAPLAAGLMSDGRDGVALLDRAYYWTNGHPFLTQSVCARIAEDSAIRTPSDVDALIAEMFFSASARRGNVHLADVANRMLTRKTGEIDPADDAQKAAILALYEQVWRGKPRIPDDETNPLVSLLKLSGAVRVERGALRIRNHIYERVFGKDWIAESLPDAEGRLQKAAFRRGLLLAGGLAATIIAIIGSLAVVAYRYAVMATAETKAAERATYTSNMNLIQREWEANNIGHVLELLEETKKYKDRGFEWGYWNYLCHLELKTMPKTGPPVVYSPDGRYLFTNDNSDEPGTGILWDAKALKKLRYLAGHQVSIGYAEFSPNGRLIATDSESGEVYIWDTSNGKHLLTLKARMGNVRCVAFSPDSKRIATGSQRNTATVYDSDTGKEKFTLKGHKNSVVGIVFSPNGNRIVTVSEDNTVKIWATTTGKEALTFKGDMDSVEGMTVSQNGKQIMIRGRKGIKVWNAETGKEIFTLKGLTGVGSALSFSPDGRRIVAGDDNTVRMWEVNTSKEILRLEGHKGDIYFVRYSPDGKQIATQSRDNTVKVWNAETGEEILTIKGDKSPFWRVVFSPDGKRIATGNENTVKIWNAEIDRTTLTLTGYRSLHENFPHRGIPILSAAFSPDGKRILMGTNLAANICDAETGREIIKFNGLLGIVGAVAFSPDGKRIAIGTVNTTMVYDAETGKNILTFKGHKWPVYYVAFSPDSKRIVTGANGEVKIWEAETGKETPIPEGLLGIVGEAVFSPDGKIIVTKDDQNLKIRNFETGKVTLILKETIDHIDCLAFSPNGKRIATGAGNTAIVWDAETGKKIFTLKGHTNTIYSIAFSPDSKRIVTGAQNSGVKIWNAETGKEMLTLGGLINTAWWVAFSPDGNRVAAVYDDYTVRIWSANFTDTDIFSVKQSNQNAP